MISNSRFSNHQERKVGVLCILFTVLFCLCPTLLPSKAYAEGGGGIKAVNDAALASRKYKRPAKSKRRTKASKETIGRVEALKLVGAGLWVDSRVDTGAKTCSLHAANIREEYRSGKLYVKFDTADDQGKKQTLLREVRLQKKVKNTEGKSERRYVIREKVMLGGQYFEADFTLNERSGMRYKVLLGRNLLLGRFVVDVALSHVLGALPAVSPPETPTDGDKPRLSSKSR